LRRFRLIEINFESACRDGPAGAPSGLSGEVDVKHYRVNKVTKPDGEVLKRKDILAHDDRQALERAASDEDCPVCDVLHAGQKIGSIT
jgi:hypothetical protein